MSLGRRLRTAVLVPDTHGVFVHFSVGDRVPGWAVEALGDSDVWDKSEQASEEPVREGESAEEPVQAESTQEPEIALETPSEDVEADADEDLIGAEAPAAVEMPAKNGSLEEWKAFARAQGAADEDLEGKSRNEIRSAYGD